MEVRTIDHWVDSLKTIVFSDEKQGFEVASVIITGKEDAVLIDTVVFGQ